MISQDGPHHRDDELPGDEHPSRILITPSDDEIREFSAASIMQSGVSRRTVLRVGAAGAAVVALTAGKCWGEPYLAQKGLLSTDGVFAAAPAALTDLIYIETFPTSPLIVEPFKDPLPIPPALNADSAIGYSAWAKPPGPGVDQQNSMSGNNGERHQIWPSDVGVPDPIVYKIDVLVDSHSFTTSQVLPITRRASLRSRSMPPANRWPPAPDAACRAAPSMDSTGRSRARGSMPSTASRAWCASRTTWTRIR